MNISSVALQNFRSYASSSYSFSPAGAVIVGPNTAGKTNLIEALFLLSTGKSFRAEKDIQMVQFEKSIARVAGTVGDRNLEVIVTHNYSSAHVKKYLVNGIPKRRSDFASQFSAVLFSPLDVEVVTDSPSLRRGFLDTVLEQVDRQYRIAHLQYTKALRQRNALLEHMQESGIRNEKQFEYWDQLLITNGQYITEKREEFLEFVNSEEKEIFNLQTHYDHSKISPERLAQYKDAELGAGVTLVGPHRDDFSIEMRTDEHIFDIKQFGSRGQQRLAILQLKLLQIAYIEKLTGERPVLLLDDIFSELDNQHIHHVTGLIHRQQTIVTTTHKEFLQGSDIGNMNVIELHISE